MNAHPRDGGHAHFRSLSCMDESIGRRRLKLKQARVWHRARRHPLIDMVICRPITMALPLRLEAYHAQFASPHGKMWIFGAIAEPLVRPTLDARHQFGLRGGAGAPLVGDHNPWDGTLVLEQLRISRMAARLFLPFCSRASSTEPLASPAPQPVFLSLDRHHHFIELPLVGKLASGTPPQLMSEFEAKRGLLPSFLCIRTL